ncbi:MAG: type VI secretion system baseplate subunit TssE [Limnobacter sp.]|nr:type VI secretion system baseplate subunit TssE [Limnobacter sp.]
MSKSGQRLQPALLQRLSDDHPEVSVDTLDQCTLSRDQLRQDVLKHLEEILNARCPLTEKELAAHPALKGTALAYGMPCLTGKTVSTLDVRGLEKLVADAIALFEPRIEPSSIEVKAEQQIDMLNRYNVIALRIGVLMWAEPFPIELLLRSEVDLESSRVSLKPAYN